VRQGFFTGGVLNPFVGVYDMKTRSYTADMSEN